MTRIWVLLIQYTVNLSRVTSVVSAQVDMLFFRKGSNFGCPILLILFLFNEVWKRKEILWFPDLKSLNFKFSSPIVSFIDVKRIENNLNAFLRKSRRNFSLLVARRNFSLLVDASSVCFTGKCIVLQGPLCEHVCGELARQHRSRSNSLQNG